MKKKSKVPDWLFWNFNDSPPNHHHTETNMHILFSPTQTPLIAAESQTCVTAGAVSTDNNSTEANIGLKCLMADTPVRWKGLWAVWTRPLTENKERICFFRLSTCLCASKKGEHFDEGWNICTVQQLCVAMLHCSHCSNALCLTRDLDQHVSSLWCGTPGHSKRSTWACSTKLCFPLLAHTYCATEQNNEQKDTSQQYHWCRDNGRTDLGQLNINYF